MSTFKYGATTRALKKYLKLSGQRPGYVYPKISHNPTDKSKQAVKKWRADLEMLRAKLPEGEPAAYYEAKKVWHCRDESQQGETMVETSPSGKYTLAVSQHSTGKNTWAYTKGSVGGEGLSEPLTVYRNYSAFPFSWVEDHPNGHDYLIAGEDYQGQTVLELDTGKRVDYLPGEAQQGHGFCWTSHYPSPDGLMVAVEGCVWGGPYQVIICDFSEPMNPPWPEPLDSDNEDFYGYEDFCGWVDNDSCRVGRRFDQVNVPGHRLHGKAEPDMTAEEMGEVERLAVEREVGEDELYELGEDSVLWERSA